ncbi:hypothetical protein Maq22A_c28020 [Methylobacterium aquaticum]|uniref:Uncharacterized protein n=2 Tax=Methylobacterium TaxID=407 RepID=A0A1Y0ZBR5_9HYPH|nr:hypothetical protein Maq22A_c28020 [Methylobacterium aquaticum]
MPPRPPARKPCRKPRRRHPGPRPPPTRRRRRSPPAAGRARRPSRMELANPWRQPRGRRLPSRERMLLLLTGTAIGAVGIVLSGAELLGHWLG